MQFPINCSCCPLQGMSLKGHDICYKKDTKRPLCTRCGASLVKDGPVKTHPGKALKDPIAKSICDCVGMGLGDLAGSSGESVAIKAKDQTCEASSMPQPAPGPEVEVVVMPKHKPTPSVDEEPTPMASDPDDETSSDATPPMVESVPVAPLKLPQPKAEPKIEIPKPPLQGGELSYQQEMSVLSKLMGIATSRIEPICVTRVTRIYNIPRADNRLVSDRNVSRTEQNLAVRSVVYNTSLRTRSRIVLFFALCFVSFVSALCAYCQFQDPKLHALLMRFIREGLPEFKNLPDFDFSYELGVAVVSLCTAAAMRSWAFSRDGVYVGFHYVPHLISCLYKESGHHLDPSVEITNLRAKIRRFATIPIPDTDSDALINGTELAYLEYVKEDFCGPHLRMFL